MNHEAKGAAGEENIRRQDSKAPTPKILILT
jgi:hypothetical protein